MVVVVFVVKGIHVKGARDLICIKTHCFLIKTVMMVLFRIAVVAAILGIFLWYNPSCKTSVKVFFNSKSVNDMVLLLFSSNPIQILFYNIIAETF